MSQNPNDPNYNPYGPNPAYPNPNMPGTPPPGTAYGGPPQPPSGPDPNTPSQPNYGSGAYNTPSQPNPNYGSGAYNTPSQPNSNYGSGAYNSPYAPPPPPSNPGGLDPYANPAMPVVPNANPYDPYAQTVMSPGQAYSAYNPPPGMMGTPPLMPPQPGPAQKKRSRGGTIILAVVALIVIVGGIVGFLAYNNNQNNIHVTATAQANSAATAHANSTATIQNQANATGTASAVANTYPFSNNLVLNDPLVDNSKGVNWDNDGTDCFFSGSAYHVFDNQANTYGTCAATKTDYANFTFQVEMLIKKGNDNSGGGLIFRADEANSKYYRLFIDDQGNYGILVSVDTTGSNGNARVLTQGTATASQFNQGLGQTNTIAVVVRGDQIAFYINQQQITTVTDSTYTHGQIGFTADDQNADTETVYNNLKVWQLP